MQVTQTFNEGLKREYRVVVPVVELAKRADTRLEELKSRVNINGFRPGKVPLAHVKRLYGRSVMAEQVEAVIEEAHKKIADDNGYKFASQPKPKLPEDEAEAMKVFDGKLDLDFSTAFEILPKITLADFSAIEITKPTAEVPESDVQEVLNTMLRNNRAYEPKEGEAADGDSLKIDFTGYIEDVAFEGGHAKGAQLVIGSNQFIPGFGSQLIGAKAGDDKTVNVTFPEDYNAAQLAGKEARFDVKVQEVSAPVEAELNDEFAKTLGFEDLEKLKDAVKSNISNQFSTASRMKAKRALLDALDKAHQFELPPSMVEQEFNNVWGQVTSELQANQKTFEDEDTTEEKAREEYRTIAERRVRLGLVMGEIGQINEITVSDQELTQAVINQARQFPGQEKLFYDYIKKNNEVLMGLRAPLFEDKVVDHLLTVVKVNEQSVSKEDLFKEDEPLKG